MKWVTRRHVRINRVATAWLVRRFIVDDALYAALKERRESGR